ncbi:GNAT family N-acetyltransferase [Actinospica sp. MGRD01-02]|uniref:GNAT family N-acetyltransferase n=1 Tax=Actinospica acidithermotolerans TaxID=2828514 RepID=A0A941IHP2_9ACTN|nr:GNAT family N-acetyltransferase [Actinospica acidithermotolerans]MBR7827429.1 GNAT family N-acetyltransferase [Actinospica acidithermotolerans]
MTLQFEVDPELTEQLRAEIVACWTDVTNAGGAVGFVPPVAMDDVLPTAEKQFAGVLAGQARLVVGRVAAGEQAGRLAALAFLVGGDFAFTAHWQTVRRVMVHPDFQGEGYGYALMAEIAAVARESGLELLLLDCRGGTGADLFYKKCGYEEYGRLPKALKLPGRTEDGEGATPYRDRILMALEL